MTQLWPLTQQAAKTVAAVSTDDPRQSVPAINQNNALRTSSTLNPEARSRKHNLARVNDNIFFLSLRSITLKINTYECGGIAPRLLNLGTRWSLVMTFTTWLLLSSRNVNTVPTGERAPLWTEKSLHSVHRTRVMGQPLTWHRTTVNVFVPRHVNTLHADPNIGSYKLLISAT